jgi:hypothetical protein
LIILTFPKRGDLETEGVGKSIYDKYMARTKFKPKTARVIRFPANQFRNENTLAKINAADRTMPTIDVVYGSLTGGHVEEEVSNSDNVGVYLACHGYGRRPTIFGAQYSAGRVNDWEPSDYSMAIANVLDGLGLRKIRKICLIICGTEEKNSSGDPRLIESLSAALKEKMGAAPMIAGYDDYISTLWSDKDLDFPNATEQGLVFGSKVVKVSQEGKQKRVLAAQNTDQLRNIKFVCVNGQTLSLANSGWSDKNRSDDWTPSLV